MARGHFSSKSNKYSHYNNTEREVEEKIEQFFTNLWQNIRKLFSLSRKNHF